jgi:hypothetical protein
MMIFIEMAQRIERGRVGAIENLNVRMRRTVFRPSRHFINGDANAAFFADLLPRLYAVTCLYRPGLGVCRISTSNPVSFPVTGSTS